jgi:hypothetical protein
MLLSYVTTEKIIITITKKPDATSELDYYGY